MTINQAAALAMADGPRVGLALLATLDVDDRLDRYQPLLATRADLLSFSESPCSATDQGGLARTPATRMLLGSVGSARRRRVVDLCYVHYKFHT